MSYKIQLEKFEGPLDLLLYFIRRDELDIYDIPISKITEDFISTINEPKNKETTLFHLYCLFADKSEQQILSEKYDAPGLRYGDVKLELFEKIMDYFAPYRKKRSMLQSKPDDIKDILTLGAKKAKLVALEVLDKVRSIVGLHLN